MTTNNPANKYIAISPAHSQTRYPMIIAAIINPTIKPGVHLIFSFFTFLAGRLIKTTPTFDTIIIFTLFFKPAYVNK